MPQSPNRVPLFLSFLVLSLSLGCTAPPARHITAQGQRGSDDIREDADTDQSEEEGQGADGSDRDETSDVPSDTSDANEMSQDGQDPNANDTKPTQDTVKTPDTDTDQETPSGVKLEECKNSLSVSRLQKWFAAEGQMQPGDGASILVKEDQATVAKVKFIGNDWHVVPVWLKNQFEAEVDLSASKGLQLTYSATADLYVQLRPGFEWSGGNKYLSKIPATGGMTKTMKIDFDATSWTTLDALGKPSYAWTEALKHARGLVFVGNLANTLSIHQLTVDGFEPPCL